MHSLYIHVPFCNSICYYCDFNRTIFTPKNADAWLYKIQEEMLDTIKDENIYSIYIGGGTPTSLQYDQLETLLKCVSKYKKNCVEYTIESNIESLDIRKIQLMKQYGVNRISLGVQSLHDDLLKEMGRKHQKKDVLSKIEEIYLNGVTNISVDLIYGFENQKLDDFIEDVEILANNKYINHISMYSLTIEENSMFNKLGKQTCSNEMEALFFKKGIETLEKNGFHHYEIANFSRINYESKHNKTYWRYDDFYGIGLGASGKEKNIRYDKIGTIQDYINGTMHIEYSELTKEDCMFENIMMSLRMKEGLDLVLFKDRYDVDFKEYYKKELDDLIKRKQVYIKDEHLCVYEDAMFVLHDILIQFMR